MAHCFLFVSIVLTARLTKGYLEVSLLRYYKQDNYFGLFFFFKAPT